jgi:hypothetical protein
MNSTYSSPTRNFSAPASVLWASPRNTPLDYPGRTPEPQGWLGAKILDYPLMDWT